MAYLARVSCIAATLVNKKRKEVTRQIVGRTHGAKCEYIR